jgi:hypothetical protein
LLADFRFLLAGNEASAAAYTGQAGFLGMAEPAEEQQGDCQSKRGQETADRILAISSIHGFQSHPWGFATLTSA